MANQYVIYSNLALFTEKIKRDGFNNDGTPDMRTTQGRQHQSAIKNHEKFEAQHAVSCKKALDAVKTATSEKATTQDLLAEKTANCLPRRGIPRPRNADNLGAKFTAQVHVMEATQKLATADTHLKAKTDVLTSPAYLAAKERVTPKPRVMPKPRKVVRPKKSDPLDALVSAVWCVDTAGVGSWVRRCNKCNKPAWQCEQFKVCK